MQRVNISKLQHAWDLVAAEEASGMEYIGREFNKGTTDTKDL